MAGREGRRPSGRRQRNLAPYGLLAPFCLLFLLSFLAPIGFAVYQSLYEVKRTGPLGLGGTRLEFAGLQNYAEALSHDQFVASVVRVLLYAAVQVPVMILLALTLALLLDSASARWPRFFRTAYFLPYGVPGVIASILWGFLYVPGVSPITDVLGTLGMQVNFLDADSVLWAMGNIVTWEFAGYNMLIIVAQLQSIGSDLYEAARIDGASGWQLVRRIKIPLVRPAIILTTVFTIIGTLQLFAEPLVLKPLSTSIGFDFTPNMSAYNDAFNNNDYHLAAAKAVLLALAAFVLSFGFLHTIGRGGRE